MFIGKGKNDMLRRIFLPMLVLLLTMSACAQSIPIDPTPSTTNGIEGWVTEGPMCPGPVPVGNNPCPNQPYQATIIILNANNTQVAQTQSNANGYFKIELAPGTYTIHPVSGKSFPYAADQTVTVVPGQYSQVTIMFDTGMR